MNALSSQPGGLADAAEGEVKAIANQGRDQIIALSRVYGESKNRPIVSDSDDTTNLATVMTTWI